MAVGKKVIAGLRQSDYRPAMTGYVAFIEGAGAELFFSHGATRAAFCYLGEEVVALVIDKDERGEVLDFNLPDSLHAELRIFEKLDFLDAVLGEDGCGTADRAEIEAAVLVAGVGYLLRAVAFGDHHHRAACGLELVDIRVHAACSGGAERA